MEKKGEEWEEYNNAVQWMVMTFIITFLVTIVLAIISMPLGYLIGNGISNDYQVPELSVFPLLALDKTDFQLPRSLFVQPVASDSADYLTAFRPAHRGSHQPLPFSVKHSRLRTNCRTQRH